MIKFLNIILFFTLVYLVGTYYIKSMLPETRSIIDNSNSYLATNIYQSGVDLFVYYAVPATECKVGWLWAGDELVVHKSEDFKK